MFQDYKDLLGIIGTILGFIGLILFIPRRGPKPPLKDPLTYAILAINLVFTALLPLQLIAEFPKSSDSRYADYIFYFRHYPHITIFPILFFGLAVLFILRAFYIWRERAPARLLWRIVVAFALAMLVASWEMSGRQMMLFEFNEQAQSATGPFRPELILEKAKTVGLENAFDPAATLGQQVMADVNNGLSPPKAATQRMDELLNHYGAWEELGIPWKSKSRAFYVALFSYMMFVMILGFALSVFLPKTTVKKRVQEARNAKISVNLLGAFFVFLLWMPFRIFSNVNTKIPLFGPHNIWDNFLGKFPFPTMWGLTAADILPLGAITFWTIILVVRIWLISRKYTVILFALGGVLLVSGIWVLARVDREAFLEVTGVDQDVKYIAFRILLTFVVTLFVYQFVESIPPRVGGNGKGRARPPKARLAKAKKPETKREDESSDSN
jgi:hypothetical protein